MRVPRIVVLGAILLLLVAPALPARAALFVVLDWEEGPPGETVLGRTGGEGAFVERVSPLPAYLVPARIVQDLDESVTNERALEANPDLVRVGQLSVDARGNGWIEFRVPDVRPAAYELFLLCQGCAQHSAGRNFVPVADFRVTDPLGRYSRHTLPWAPMAAAFLAALVLIGSLVGRGGRPSWDNFT